YQCSGRKDCKQGRIQTRLPDGFRYDFLHWRDFANGNIRVEPGYGRAECWYQICRIGRCAYDDRHSVNRNLKVWQVNTLRSVFLHSLMPNCTYNANDCMPRFIIFWRTKPNALT